MSDFFKKGPPDQPIIKLRLSLTFKVAEHICVFKNKGGGNNG